MLSARRVPYAASPIERKSPWILFGIIFLIWCGIFLLFNDDRTSIQFILSYGFISLFLSFPFLIFLVMLLRFNLKVNGKVYFRGVFKHIEIDVSDIKNVAKESGYSKASKDYNFFQRIFLPPFRLVFYGRSTGKPILTINRAIISRQGERSLMQWISGHNIPLKRH